MGRRTDIDWVAIERDYRTGRFTDRQLGKLHGVNHASIGRRATRDGWAKDLSDEIKTRTRAALARQAAGNATTEAESDERAIAVQVATNVEVVRQHQDVLQRVQTLARKLLISVERNIESLLSEEAPRGMTGRMQNMAQCNAALQSVHSLMQTLGRSIPLERQAFNLGNDGEGTHESFLEQLPG
jgi:methionine synthase I (cobalamin-dependent)